MSFCQAGSSSVVRRRACVSALSSFDKCTLLRPVFGRRAWTPRPTLARRRLPQRRWLREAAARQLPRRRPPRRTLRAAARWTSRSRPAAARRRRCASACPSSPGWLLREARSPSSRRVWSTRSACAATPTRSRRSPSRSSTRPRSSRGALSAAAGAAEPLAAPLLPTLPRCASDIAPQVERDDHSQSGAGRRRRCARFLARAEGAGVVRRVHARGALRARRPRGDAGAQAAFSSQARAAYPPAARSRASRSCVRGRGSW